MKKYCEYNLKHNQETIIEIKGTEYERSYQIGKMLKKAIREETKIFAKKINKSLKTQEYLNNMTLKLKNEYLYIYDNILGRAEGAGISYDTYLYYMCKEYWKYEKEHCTSIMVNTENNIILGHNEDDEYTNDNIKVVKHICDNGRKYIELANSNSIEFSTIFVAENYIFTMNFIWFAQFDFNYLPMNMYMKMLAECNDVEQLFECIKNTPVASALGINLYDRVNNKLYYVEKALTEYSIKEINGINVHANHLVADNLIKYMPNFLYMRKSTTLNRQMIAQSLINGRDDLNADDVKEILTLWYM